MVCVAGIQEPFRSKWSHEVTTHPSHTAMLEGRLLTMRQEVRRAVGEVRAALYELDRADAEIARCLIGIRAIEGDIASLARRENDSHEKRI